MKRLIALASTCLLVFVFCGCGRDEPKISSQDLAARHCANQLRMIDATKHRWAEQHGAGLNDTPTADDLEPYFRHGFPKCHEGGAYTIGKVGELPQCSIPAHNEYFKAHLTPDQDPAQ